MGHDSKVAGKIKSQITRLAHKISGGKLWGPCGF